MGRRIRQWEQPCRGRSAIGAGSLALEPAPLWLPRTATAAPPTRKAHAWGPAGKEYFTGLVQRTWPGLTCLFIGWYWAAIGGAMRVQILFSGVP